MFSLRSQSQGEKYKRKEKQKSLQHDTKLFNLMGLVNRINTKHTQTLKNEIDLRVRTDHDDTFQS